MLKFLLYLTKVSLYLPAKIWPFFANYEKVIKYFAFEERRYCDLYEDKVILRVVKI